MTTDIMPAAFDQFWAVVLYDQHGGTGLWSPENRMWRQRRDHTASFVTEPRERGQSGLPFEPFADDVAAVVDAATNLARHGCYRCGSIAPADHLIAPNQIGDATRYCVQRPDPNVVESSGGGGSKKHWGSSHGCASVRSPQRVWDERDELTVSYGEPMTANDIRDADWCNRCTGNASNVRDDDAARRAERVAAGIDEKERLRAEDEAQRIRDRELTERVRNRQGWFRRDDQS